MSRKRPWQDEFPPHGSKRSSGGAQMDEIEDQEFVHQLTDELLSCLLPPTEAQHYHTVWRDVRACLHKTLRMPFNLHQFGSTATGLAFTGSDIDLCLEVFEPSPRPLLNAVQAALRQHRYLFGSVVSVRGARVPIVKFRHLHTGIDGDISFSGTLAVRNTELIRLLCSMDPRVKPLLALTKRWAKIQGVANQEGDNNRISSYALIMMAIFYLQTRQILPPIAAIQAWCPRKEFELGWECGFAPMPWTTRLPHVSMRDIVVGFFLFYAEFPFDKDVICPLLGRPAPRSAFLDASTLPPEMAAYADRIVPADKETNKDPAGEHTEGTDLASKNTTTDPNNKLPIKMKQATHQTNSSSSNQTNDSSANQTKNNSSVGQTQENPSASQTQKTNQPARRGKTRATGLSLAKRAICVQDPFVLDHNVVNGQTPSAFERFAKVLTHAADICKKTSGSTLLRELLTPVTTTKVILKRTLRHSPDQGPADKWSPAATGIAQRILETVVALRLEQTGALSFSCAAHHDVIENRSAALSECKEASCLSPVEVQERASARMLGVGGPSHVALARFGISLQPGLGPSLAISATGEEPGVKTANYFVHFLMSGLMKWIPAELRYRALNDRLKPTGESERSEIDTPLAVQADRIESGQKAKKKKKKKKKKTTVSQTTTTLSESRTTVSHLPITWLESELAEIEKIKAIMSIVKRVTAKVQPIAARVQNKIGASDPTAAREQNVIVTSYPTSESEQNYGTNSKWLNTGEVDSSTVRIVGTQKQWGSKLEGFQDSLKISAQSVLSFGRYSAKIVHKKHQMLSGTV